MGEESNPTLINGEPICSPNYPIVIPASSDRPNTSPSSLAGVNTDHIQVIITY